MDLKIIATCSGLEKIYPGIRESNFEDIRTSSKSGNIGDRCYTISLKEKSIEISKLIGILDSNDHRSGFLRIVIILSYNEINFGYEIFNTLNSIHDLFINHYIEYGKINLDRFYGNLHLLDDIKSSLPSINTDLQINPKKSVSSRTKNANIYYKSFDGLIKYFDKPNQLEYYEYNTIYFIHEEERDQNINPLYQFIKYDVKNENDLTEIVNLNNIEYQIIGTDGYNHNDRIECLINVVKDGEKTIKGIHEFIRKEDTIELLFKKQFYTSLAVYGKMYESDIAKYLEIDETSKTIKVINHPSLNPTEGEIDFNFKLPNNKVIFPNGTLTNKRTSKKKNIQSNKVSFSGDEWGDEWNLEIINTHEFDQYHPITNTIIPYMFTPPLEVQLSRSFKFLFLCDGKDIKNVTILYISGKGERISEYHYRFKGDQISQKHRFKAKADGYEDKIFEIWPYSEQNRVVEISFEKPTKKESKWWKYTAISMMCLAVGVGLYLGLKNKNSLNEGLFTKTPTMPDQEIVGEAPKGEELKDEAPKGEELKGAAPKDEEQKDAAPKDKEHKGEAPKGEELKGAAPKGEELKGAAPKGEELKGAAPKDKEQKDAAPKDKEQNGEAPKGEELKGAAPKGKEQKGAAPKGEEQKGEGPKRETLNRFDESVSSTSYLLTRPIFEDKFVRISDINGVITLRNYVNINAAPAEKQKMINALNQLDNSLKNGMKLTRDGNRTILNKNK